MVFIGQLVVCIEFAREHCCCSFAVIQRGKVIATIIVVVFHYFLSFLNYSFNVLLLLCFAFGLLSFFSICRICYVEFGHLASLHLVMS